MKMFVMTLLAGALLLNGTSLPAAQEGLSDAQIDREIKLMRQDLRAEKKKLVAANMQLSEAEAVKFWPLYDEYTAERTKLNDIRYDMIKEYAKSFDKLSDEQVDSLVKRLLDLDESSAKLRSKYIPLIRKAVSARKAGRFLQVDRRLETVMDVKMSMEIPLVNP